MDEHRREQVRAIDERMRKTNAAACLQVLAFGVSKGQAYSISADVFLQYAYEDVELLMVIIEDQALEIERLTAELQKARGS